MTPQDVQKYWQEGADDAFDTAGELIKSKKYHHALIFCHLALEKILKSVYVNKEKSVPPVTHNLLLIADKAEINLTSDFREQLREINNFNIEARYDDYKLKFYKKATKEFTLKWFENTKNLIVWLQKV